MDVTYFIFSSVYLVLLRVSTITSELSLASYYGNHMVLQKAPKSSQIWGYADYIGDFVTVSIGVQCPHIQTQVVYNRTIGRGVWRVMLPPQEGPGPVNMTVSSREGVLHIVDVMFGDVWLCSGQSNMQFRLRGVFNSSKEITEAKRYSNIRIFMAAEKWSNKSEFDLLGVELNWTRPSRGAVGDFSAVCWLYGKYLYNILQYPIGLLATDWGHTRIEAWSSQDALDACNTSTNDKRKRYPRNTPTQLWKAMIHPLLKMTIYGVIWYQGETNRRAPCSYSCRFQAMINDWRRKFNEGSNGQTDARFPFGFVQLAPFNNRTNIKLGFPAIRWHQTADFGYVPNVRMPNTFMSVTVDLPDFRSPFGSIHPRNKQDVAYRLFLAGLHVAYNITTMGRYQGPRVTRVHTSVGIGNHTLTLELDNAKQPIQVKSKDGFEICCSGNNASTCNGTDSAWRHAPITSYNNVSVTLPACNDQWTMGIRYLWRASPCKTPKRCPIYSGQNDLPMAPYIATGLIGSNTCTSTNYTKGK